VLLECIRKGLRGFGLEINPAAYSMSNFYSIANMPRNERASIFDRLEKKVCRVVRPLNDLPIFCVGEDFRQQHQNLIEFARDLFAILESEDEKILALNMLFICEKHADYNLESSTLSALNRIKKFALSLPFAMKDVSARIGDARMLHLLCPLRPDLIITSPPYINVFNYHQNHRAILEAVGWNMLKVAQSEFGANRKHRSNRFKTVVQYCLDMEAALYSCWESLQTGGLLILVIGRESNVRGVSFYNGRILKEMLEAMGGFAMVTDYERAFTNRFGALIKEDIVVTRKLPNPRNKTVGRTIAINHLQKALQTASPQTKEDIENALAEADTIVASPLFNNEEAFCHA
jgi:hypothetical protein